MADAPVEVVVVAAFVVTVLKVVAAAVLVAGFVLQNQPLPLQPHAPPATRKTNIPCDRTSRLSQITAHPIQEPTIRINLSHIPYHHAPKTREGLRIRDDCSKSRSSFVSSACARVPGYAQHDLHVRIQAHSLRPIIPGIKIEVILCTGAHSEGRNATVIIVKLNPHNIEVHGTCKHRAIRSIRVRTLRGGGQEPLFASVGVHEGAELLPKGGHVGDGGLEIEIEAVDYAGAEGAWGGG